MLGSALPGTEPCLLRPYQCRNAPVHNLRKSKITMTTAAPLLIIVAANVALKARRERHVYAAYLHFEHPAMSSRLVG